MGHTVPPVSHCYIRSSSLFAFVVLVLRTKCISVTDSDQIAIRQVPPQDTNICEWRMDRRKIGQNLRGLWYGTTTATTSYNVF